TRAGGCRHSGAARGRRRVLRPGALGDPAGCGGGGTVRCDDRAGAASGVPRVQARSPGDPQHLVIANATDRVPVIAVTGHLGAGKTSLLNHLLRTPGARLGVVVNDFGTLNVDAALVTGQVDEAASISGGCVCCLD